MHEKLSVCWAKDCDAKYFEGEFVWWSGKQYLELKARWKGPKLFCRTHADLNKGMRNAVKQAGKLPKKGPRT